MRIAATGLTFRYPRGAFTLRVPELTLEPGEVVACIGPSGCGKTTLLQLLAGILLPDGGAVRIDGEDTRGMGDARRRATRITRMGLVFQELELLEHLSVGENVLLPYFLNGALALDQAARERAAGLAQRLGIEADIDRPPGELSQGERQRVAVARALVARPELLLADEPTGNLDPETRRVVLEAVLAEARERDATLFFVTHDHDLLPSFDRVVDLAEVAP